MDLTIDLTSIATSVLAIVGAVATTYFVPWIQSKFSTSELEKILTIVSIAVEAAEQMSTALGWSGEDKFNYVFDYIERLGYTIDGDTLTAYIESAVYELSEKISG